jgi:hypothetical protein
VIMGASIKKVRSFAAAKPKAPAATSMQRNRIAVPAPLGARRLQRSPASPTAAASASDAQDGAVEEKGARRLAC